MYDIGGRAPLPLLPLASLATEPLVVSCGIRIAYLSGSSPYRSGGGRIWNFCCQIISIKKSWLIMKNVRAGHDGPSLPRLPLLVIVYPSSCISSVFSLNIVNRKLKQTLNGHEGPFPCPHPSRCALVPWRPFCIRVAVLSRSSPYWSGGGSAKQGGMWVVVSNGEGMSDLLAVEFQVPWSHDLFPLPASPTFPLLRRPPPLQ